jgi:linearmycin/streptolysin S transport system permease protein
MKKILAFTFKELLIITRDRMALLLMIAAPLALTLVMSFAFSRANSGGLPQISVVVVNQDGGAIGQAFVDLMQSDALKELVKPFLSGDAGAARKMVDDGQAAAAVIIPAGLTERVTAGQGDPVRIEVYGDPGRPVSAGVIRSVVERFAQQVAAGTLGAQVTIMQLIQSGRIQITEAATAGSEIGQRVAVESVDRQLVTVTGVVGSGKSEDNFNFLQYYAPSLAILFLMFAMASSARTLLAEREAGTLARLRSTPTQSWELMGGKVAGILATGLLQMMVLVVMTSLLMGVKWGDPLGVAVHVLLVVAATASMGLVIATVARTTSQANAIGGAVVMVLAAVGGNFIPRPAYPEWMRLLSYVGPNSWGIEGFQKLAAGATLAGLRVEVAALLAMTGVFFAISLWGFRRWMR